ncbi:hypothetical protein BPAE_0231g00140 [Botrytis paeoniae]|uniref:Uncharacterized protein n=1 Tax=Botrytis paeoniae TaxID=278948 RepID=A0A4Z1FHW7_9HELO|nr:hypothetical protein BPAE_0231g00140 [Botrytis paeoniae]
MPNTDHYVLKRSGWLLLLFFTHLSASCLRNSLYHDFLVANFEKNPPSSYMWDYELECFHCRERSQKWEERAKTEGIKTPFGIFLFKAEDEDEKTAAAIINGAVGGFFAIGCAGLWKTRGVWGWWAVPTGLGLWAAFFADLYWVVEKGVDKLEMLEMLDYDEEEEEDDDEDEDEDADILPPLLWIND